VHTDKDDRGDFIMRLMDPAQCRGNGMGSWDR